MSGCVHQNGTFTRILGFLRVRIAFFTNLQLNLPSSRLVLVSLVKLFQPHHGRWLMVSGSHIIECTLSNSLSVAPGCWLSLSILSTSAEKRVGC